MNLQIIQQYANFATYARKYKKLDMHCLKIIYTYLKSCKRSFALYIVIRDVVAAGMIMIGVLDTIKIYTYK